MDRVGMAAIAAVLLVGVAVGLGRRRTDGRLRPVGAAAGRACEPVAGTGAAAGHSSAPAADRLDPELLTALGVGPADATLLQFSSAFCAPCRAVRRISSEVAGMIPGVQHVEIDAESHLDQVRALNIWRTPTLLVLDSAGRVTRRATGVPTKPHLIAELETALSRR
jgi:hypothetical protein